MSIDIFEATEYVLAKMFLNHYANGDKRFVDRAFVESMEEYLNIRVALPPRYNTALIKLLQGINRK
jgi:hypothetical protein